MVNQTRKDFLKAVGAATLAAAAGCTTTGGLEDDVNRLFSSLDPNQDTVFISYNGREMPPGPDESTPGNVEGWYRQIEQYRDSLTDKRQVQKLNDVLMVIDLARKHELDLVVLERYTSLRVESSMLVGPRDTKPSVIIYGFDPGSGGSVVEKAYEEVRRNEGYKAPNVDSYQLKSKSLKGLKW